MSILVEEHVDYSDIKKMDKSLTPVVEAIDSYVRIIDSNVANSELLVRDRHAILAAIEDNI
jgi:hypothetical protein